MNWREREVQLRFGVGGGLAVIAILCTWTGGVAFYGLIAFFAATAAMEWIDLYRRARKRETAVAWMLGAVYIGGPAAALIWLRDGIGGLEWVYWLFGIVWAADTGAFFVGRTFGRAKLWPAVSPGKTWAGFWGANAAAALTGLGVGRLFALDPLKGLGFGLVLGLAAQGGDLFESWIKRRARVKDSGNLLPGHGGVLDRIDSLVPVIPSVAGLVAVGLLP